MKLGLDAELQNPGPVSSSGPREQSAEARFAPSRARFGSRGAEQPAQSLPGNPELSTRGLSQGAAPQVWTEGPRASFAEGSGRAGETRRPVRPTGMKNTVLLPPCRQPPARPAPSPGPYLPAPSLRRGGAAGSAAAARGAARPRARTDTAAPASCALAAPAGTTSHPRPARPRPCQERGALRAPSPTGRARARSSSLSPRGFSTRLSSLRPRVVAPRARPRPHARGLPTGSAHLAFAPPLSSRPGPRPPPGRPGVEVPR